MTAPLPNSEAGVDRLRADLLMSAELLDDHVRSLARLQDEFAASRREVAELWTLVGNQQAHAAALENHAAELRATLEAQRLEPAPQPDPPDPGLAAPAADTTDGGDAAQLRAEVAHLRSEMARLLNSMSWRMTAPVRAVVVRLRRR